MDPLSLTVAASNLLSAVNTVIIIVSRYHKEMKKTPRDLERFTEELKRLSDVLGTLESLIQEAKVPTPDVDPKLKALVPLYEPLTLYLDDIKILQGKLEVPSWSYMSQRKRSLAVALGWPLKEDEVKNELDKMKSFREQLKDAIQVDTINLAVESQKIVSENQKILTQLVRSWRNRSTADHRQKLLRWLAAPDIAANYQAALKRRSEDTGSWFSESKPYLQWVAAPRSFLWLYGIAGSGKTILTSTAIESALAYAQNTIGIAVVYFYFDFNDSDKQLVEKMVRSLVKQLSLQCPETPHILSMLFATCEASDRSPSLDELLETMRQLMHSYCDVYMVLDALDECSERDELLDILARFRDWSLNHLHILVSSRPERSIEEGISPHLSDNGNKVEICGELIDEDIRHYIQGRLERDPKLKRWRKTPDVRGEIEHCLMSKAKGMFRLAVCHLDELATCLNRPQLRQRLNCLPRTLDQMYSQMLLRIPEELEPLAFKILQWLTYSARQLNVTEVAEALCVDCEDIPRFDPDRRLPDPQDVLEACPGLIVTVDIDADTEAAGGTNDTTTQATHIRLAHYSVKEFLVSARVHEHAPRFRLDDAPASHASMAETCLAYLLSFERRDSIYPGVMSEFHLIAYASQYWFWHACMAAPGTASETTVPLIMELLDSPSPAYANWLRIYNPDKPWQSPGSSLLMEDKSDDFAAPPPLYIASLCGLTLVVSAILEGEADVNQSDGGEKGSALHAASYGGHADVIRGLVVAGAEINGGDGVHTGSPLQAAAFNGHGQAVETLLELGADVNQTGGKYANPLQAACRAGKLAIVEKLLGAGADIHASGGFYGDALQAASFYGHDAIVRILLAAGADINRVGGIYGSALQAASRNGYAKLVQDLLQAGAHVNLTGGMYHTALQSAARGGQKAIIDILVSAGADVNAQGGKYGNALQAASLLDNASVVKYLLELGADVNARGGMYGCALQTACAHGYEQVVCLLLNSGADPNLPGGYYGLPIIAAAKQGHASIVEKLLDTGTRIQGWKLSIAITSEGHKEAVQLLRKAGAKVMADGEDDVNRGDGIVGGGLKRSQTMSLVAQEFTGEGIEINENEIRQVALSLKFCDECGQPIPDGDIYYHCNICLNDDWDSCIKCVQAGFVCQDRQHRMVRRRIQNGMIIDMLD
ncbi:ankyrin repeat-containing domain protein [Aspergillus californicus]